jgi:polyisoprenoid-binding protein YceI
VVLHVTGALKHHVIDRDATLRRMLPGHTPAEPTARQPGHALPFASALVVWAVVLGGAGALGWYGQADGGGGAALAQVESEWQVQEGTLEITAVQMGSEVKGSFADWTADISYAQAPDADGQHGKVTVTVAIGSLTLGSVTDQAMGADFFNVEDYPTATFRADLLSTDEGHVARGELTIKGQTVPVDMPFELDIEGDTARASGGLTVDRRKFDIGQGVTDPDTLAYSVDVRFELTATRG